MNRAYRGTHLLQTFASDCPMLTYKKENKQISQIILSKAFLFLIIKVTLNGWVAYNTKCP